MFLHTYESHSFLFFFVLIFLSLTLLFTHYSENSFVLLTVSELFWISLYALAILVSFIFNSVYSLALSLYFLMFSAAEISLGILIFIVQISSNKTISFDLVKN